MNLIMKKNKIKFLILSKLTLQIKSFNILPITKYMHTPAMPMDNATKPHNSNTTTGNNKVFFF